VHPVVGIAKALAEVGIDVAEAAGDVGDVHA
jgi:hypothetical protein